MFKLYGIPNCNTVKKAQSFLKLKQVDYEFINFKKTLPTVTQINKWQDAFDDWPVNKKGPTFRKIKDDFENANSEEKISLILENTSAIKRPILEKDETVLAFGFDEEKYSQLLGETGLLKN